MIMEQSSALGCPSPSFPSSRMRGALLDFACVGCELLGSHQYHHNNSNYSSSGSICSNDSMQYTMPPPNYHHHYEGLMVPLQGEYANTFSSLLHHHEHYPNIIFQPQELQQPSISFQQDDSCGHNPIRARWCPTKKQKETLEDIFESGMRTPSRKLIEEITLQLRQYGCISEANVFYWFQNRKARAKRKRLSSQENQQNQVTMVEKNRKKANTSLKAHAKEDPEQTTQRLPIKPPLVQSSILQCPSFETSQNSTSSFDIPLPHFDSTLCNNTSTDFGTSIEENSLALPSIVELHPNQGLSIEAWSNPITSSVSFNMQSKESDIDIRESTKRKCSEEQRLSNLVPIDIQFWEDILSSLIRP